MSAVSINAQPAPVEVIQGSDGTLYLAQGINAWTMVPNAIADAELAALVPSGELDGAIPSPFLSASDALAPLRVVQDGGGTLHLVQARNVWVLVPTQISDADLAALSLVGQIGGEISAPALSLPSPSADAMPPGEAGPPAPMPLAGQTIRIISLMPHTGPAQSATDSMAKAIRMALDEAHGNAAGATVIYEDVDSATPGVDSSRLMDPDPFKTSNAMVFIGGIDEVSLNVRPTGQNYQFHLVSRGAGMCGSAVATTWAWMAALTTVTGWTKKTPGVGTEFYSGVNTEPGCHRMTRIVPAEDVQATAAATWSRQLGASRVYLLYDSPWYGTLSYGNPGDLNIGPAADYGAIAPKLGLTVVGGPDRVSEPNLSGLKDYSALVHKIRQSGADLVYVGTAVGAWSNNPKFMQLWRELRAGLGGNVKLMASNGIYNQKFLDDAGPVAEGSYVVSPSVPYTLPTGAGAQFYANYKATFNAEPDGYAIYGYETMKVALDGIRRAGKNDRTAIREAIFTTRDFDGALGRWSFTETGDRTPETVYGRQVRNGRFDEANAVPLTVP